MPSGYTYKGLVGAVQNDASDDFIDFKQVNNSVSLITIVADYDTANSGSTALTLPLTVPPSTVAQFTVSNSGNTTANYTLITDLDQTDSTPALTLHDIISSSAFSGTINISKRVDSSSQVRVRQSNANGDLLVTTHGWKFE
jgi:hypothetical protein